VNGYPHVHLRIYPLTWRILARGGWYRAVPFFELADVDRLVTFRRREWLAGITASRQTPWVPGDTAASQDPS